MKPKVAIVYDWVNTRYGGAEKVLVALNQVYPDAPLYTSVYDKKAATWAKNFKVIPSFLQKIPLASRFHRLLFPLMPLAFEQFDLTGYDIVISVTSAEAKGIHTKPEQLHINYLLTPTRYLYSHKQSYLDNLPHFPFFKPAVETLLNYLTWWDDSASARPDHLIPISQKVAKRINRYYQRSSQPVIYPPVEVAITNRTDKTYELPFEEYFLVVARLVPYKGIDTAIRACVKANKNLAIVGDGPDLYRLQKLVNNLDAQDQIIFTRNVQPAELSTLYKRAQALLMPGVEDFGITALESLAHHTPVIINKNSGAAELIKPGKTGELLEKNDFKLLANILFAFDITKYDTDIMDAVVIAHTRDVFAQKFEKVVQSLWKEHYGNI